VLIRIKANFIRYSIYCFSFLFVIALSPLSTETEIDLPPLRRTLTIKFGCGGLLGRRSEMPDTILEWGHPRIISAKFG
jgi:hypothetical protein